MVVDDDVPRSDALFLVIMSEESDRVALVVPVVRWSAVAVAVLSRTRHRAELINKDMFLLLLLLLLHFTLSSEMLVSEKSDVLLCWW